MLLRFDRLVERVACAVERVLIDKLKGLSCYWRPPEHFAIELAQTILLDLQSHREKRIQVLEQ